MDLTQEEITRIIESHKRRREYDRNRYHSVLKHDPEFVKKNRHNARKHYEEKGQKKREHYAKDKAYLSARASYRYYKRSNREELFKQLHPQKYQLLVERGLSPS